MPDNNEILIPLYELCYDLRDQLELELTIAKRSRTSELSKQGYQLIQKTNLMLTLYKEIKNKNE